jgi:hypothetical protein
LVDYFWAKIELGWAEKELRNAEKYGQPEKVYDIVSQALRQYLGVLDTTEEALGKSLEEHAHSQMRHEVQQYLQDALRWSKFAEHKHRGSSEDLAALYARGRALLNSISKIAICLICMMYPMPLWASMLDTIAEPLGTVPFIVWQLAVLISWWILWFYWHKLSSEIRYMSMFFFICFVSGLALRAPYESPIKAGAYEGALICWTFRGIPNARVTGAF